MDANLNAQTLLQISCLLLSTLVSLKFHLNPSESTSTCRPIVLPLTQTPISKVLLPCTLLIYEDATRALVITKKVQFLLP